ncbi:hypothetical protein ACOJIU_04305 [Carnobacterium maltaromaticum]|uniref:hypothetical protein n=1 Tax=Carnobacterium maltaromaticum TaxID=2751 RepID=UPI003B983BAC
MAKKKVVEVVGKEVKSIIIDELNEELTQEDKAKAASIASDEEPAIVKPKITAKSTGKLSVDVNVDLTPQEDITVVETITAYGIEQWDSETKRTIIVPNNG